MSTAPGADRAGAVIAIDAGTTGVRSVAFDESAHVVASSYRELTQYFPAPGLVEHDAGEIWSHVEATLADVAATLDDLEFHPTAIGITNQRETAIAFDRRTGSPLHRAIVWQDRRTAGACDELRAAGNLPLVRRRTGLVLDPYFSATKWAYMLAEGGVDGRKNGDNLALATVNAWVIWNLTGGTGGRAGGTSTGTEDGVGDYGVFVTDLTNASRTLCLDIHERQWSEELCDVFGVPISALPLVRPSCGRVGVVAPGVAGGALAGVPVSGIAGDQQAALFGQGCTRLGEAKATYGTGTFVLMNVGPRAPEPSEGLLTTIGWDLGDAVDAEPVVYALEGAIFASGAAIQWLRDGLGIIERADQTEALARSVPETDGVFLVPAFTGLGSPWWDPHARGTIVGLTRGAGRGHLARAVVEAIAFQARDVVDAMTAATGSQVASLYVDGGASAMDLLLQLQADQLRVPVTRRTSAEITALGAALLAGLAEGVWSGLDEIRTLLADDATFEPQGSTGRSNSLYAGWRRAVERARAWEGAPEVQATAPAS